MLQHVPSRSSPSHTQRSMFFPERKPTQGDLKRRNPTTFPFRTGSTGDSPVPLGNLPSEMTAAVRTNEPPPIDPHAPSVSVLVRPCLSIQANGHRSYPTLSDGSRQSALDVGQTFQP